MYIEDIWSDIHYKQLEGCIEGNGANHETCVFVSFCIAAYPFVKEYINMHSGVRDNQKKLQYFFERYCAYRNLDINGCLECKYTGDYEFFFHLAEQMEAPNWLGAGYRAMCMLYNSDKFEFCRRNFSLSPHNVSERNGMIDIEDELRNGATSIIAYSFQVRDEIERRTINGSHSVAFCYSFKKKKFMCRDPHNIRYEQYNSLDDFLKRKSKLINAFHINDSLVLKSTQ